uniref:Uncharacterized protein n=1 Tax=Arundo donax TaxID=35708 RepID=A0A0A9FEG3_ARUDO
MVVGRSAEAGVVMAECGVAIFVLINTRGWRFSDADTNRATTNPSPHPNVAKIPLLNQTSHPGSPKPSLRGREGGLPQRLERGRIRHVEVDGGGLWGGAEEVEEERGMVVMLGWLSFVNAWRWRRGCAGEARQGAVV